MNDSLFDMTPRRPLQRGDAVVVDTIIGPKTARVWAPPVAGRMKVAWCSHEGSWGPASKNWHGTSEVDAARVRHA